MSVVIAPLFISMVTKLFTSRHSQKAVRNNNLPIRIAPVARNVASHQVGFLFALPGDIILEIFRFLDRDDCLNCMAVCHYWYRTVPQYTHDMWKELWFCKRDTLKRHRRRERCAGSHVKNVVLAPSQKVTSYRRGVLEEQQVHMLIKIFLDLGCISIESLEFSLCDTTDQDTLLSILQPLRPCLKHLKMARHLSEVAVLRIFDAFPQLTHFSYQYNGDTNRVASSTLHHTMPINYYPNVSYLCLDVNMSKAWKEDVLKRCPNLRCFIDAHQYVYEVPTTVDLDSLFTWCPKITFLETRGINQHQDPDAYIDDNLVGLRYYNTSASYGVDQITRLLMKSQDTLKFLSLSRDRIYYDWSPIFERVQLPNLRTLISSFNDFTPVALASMLNHCPALEILCLDFSYSSPALDPPFIRSLPIMNRVRHLRLRGMKVADGLSLLTILERFPRLEEIVIYASSIALVLPLYFDGLRHLKYLEMRYIYWRPERGDDREPRVSQLFEWLNESQKLETIKLQAVPLIGQSALTTVAGISALTFLDICITREISGDGLLEFIKLLRKTTLETLKLRDVFQLSFAAMDALAELPLLSVFCVQSSGISYGTYDITVVAEQGLRQILRKAPNLTAVLFLSLLTVIGEKGSLSQNEVFDLVKEEVPQYSRFRKSPRNWDMQLDYQSTLKQLKCVIIKCVDNENFPVASVDPNIFWL